MRAQITNEAIEEALRAKGKNLVPLYKYWTGREWRPLRALVVELLEEVQAARKQGAKK